MTPGPEDRDNAWSSPFGDLLAGGSAMDASNPPFGEAHIIGDPGDVVSVWDGQQSLPDDCAVKCQQIVLEMYTGQEFSEGALVAESAANGWYTPGTGSSPAHIGDLLHVHGVATQTYDHATPYDIANELAQGHKVIIGVDSGELWDPIGDAVGDAYGLGKPGADHAVIVSGIDTTDPDNPQVIISDPGNGEALSRYPMDQFVAAWDESGCFMVATTEPAPAHLPEMVNFNYTEGHIPEVLGMPYDEFATFYDHPQDFDDLLPSVLDPTADGGGPVDFSDDGLADGVGTDDDGVTDGYPSADGGVTYFDTDGDGVADAVGYDTDGDGIADAYDTDGDGIADVYGGGHA